jgi:hypothetical protein
MGHASERGQVSGPRPVAGGMKPLVRRLLWVLGTAAAFLLLAALGLGLGSLLFRGESYRPEPEPVPVARPAPRRPPEPAPPPPAAPEPPRPAPVAAAPATPATPSPLVPTPGLTLPTRLRIRRELILGLGRFKDELARCPADPVSRPIDGRAALVLETVAETDAVRVVGSRLEAEAPVNDRFVSCARSVLEGKRLATTGATPGARLRLFLPLGPKGNSLSLSAASLTEAEQP